MLILDLSSHNDGVDFHAIKRAGIAGVWLKATEGLSWNDPTFHARRTAANAAGLRVGAYHFARPDLHSANPSAEARHFASIVAHVGLTDLRPVLDYEARTVTGVDEWWVAVWNATVKSALGVGPLFYSYPALIGELHFKKPRGYGLWLASYSRNDGVEHPYAVPAPWQKVVAHQFSSRCHVIGCSSVVDLSTVTRPYAVLAHPIRSVLPLPWRGPH